jgi:hypothetical protein
MDKGIIFFCVTIIIVVAVIFFYSRHPKRYNKVLQELKQSYEHELRHGTKQSALQVGRNYYAALRGGRLSVYDEQAIANDISTM